MKPGLIFLCLLAGIAATTASADAQGTGACLNQIAASPQPMKYVRNTAQYNSLDLTSLPNLADLPSYTGRSPRFLTGADFQRLKTGRVVEWTFLTLEDPLTVANWYRNVLKMNNWSVQDLVPGGTQIYAEKSDGSCMVTISQSTQPGYRAQVVVHYKHDNQ